MTFPRNRTCVDYNSIAVINKFLLSQYLYRRIDKILGSDAKQSCSGFFAEVTSILVSAYQNLRLRSRY